MMLLSELSGKCWKASNGREFDPAHHKPKTDLYKWIVSGMDAHAATFQRITCVQQLWAFGVLQFTGRIRYFTDNRS